MADDDSYDGKPFNHLLHEMNALEMQYIGYVSKCSPPADRLWLSSKSKVSESLLQAHKNDNHLVWRDDDMVIKMEPIILRRNNEPSKDHNFNEVIHESTVGNIINDLKHKNFARVVCHDFCHTCIPKILSNVQRYDRCAYVMYQYVPGVTLAKYILTCNEKQLIAVLWLLFNALRDGYKHCNFTHYDLHLDNIIINNTDENHPYPIIVDYGSSFVTLNTENDSIPLGRILKEGSIYIRPCWQHDVFKVCMWLYYNLKYKLASKNYKLDLLRQINYLQYEINDNRESIYRDYHIQDLSEELLSLTNTDSKLENYERVNRITYINRKLQKIDEHNAMYSQNIINLQTKILELQTRLVKLKNKPKSVLPPSPYTVASKLESLISYFTGRSTNRKWFQSYQNKYRYMQLNDEMTNKYYDFDHFLQYAGKVLSIPKTKN